MQGNFKNCLAFTLQREGGYSNDPHDPGGATMNGIIQVEYDSYRRHKNASIRPVKFITTDERDEIYFEQYWRPLRCEDLPLGVDLMVFDYGVNSGISRSAKQLQKLVRASPVDGHIGLITLEHVRGVNNLRQLIEDLASARLSFLCALTNWKYFGNGWRNRVIACKMQALKMQN